MVGNQSRVKKVRECSICESIMKVNADELKEHNELCRAAKRLGIIIPSISKPNIMIVEE